MKSPNSLSAALGARRAARYGTSKPTPALEPEDAFESSSETTIDDLVPLEPDTETAPISRVASIIQKMRRKGLSKHED